MPITSKIRGLLAQTSFLLAAMLFSQAANAVIGDIGTPVFINDIKVRAAPSGQWKFKGKDGFGFYDGSTLHDGFQGKFSLTAKFDNSNQLVSSSQLIITGAIPSLGINDKNTTLLTADLDEFMFSGNTMAFGTINLSGEICVLLGCSPNESVWFNLDDALPLNLKSTPGYVSSGIAFTTIPVPAAVWLFGSGLGLLGMVARRHRKKVS